MTTCLPINLFLLFHTFLEIRVIFDVISFLSVLLDMLGPCRCLAHVFDYDKTGIV